MDSWPNPFDDADNFDVGVDRRLSMNQTTLSPSFAVGSERFYVEPVEEIEADNSQADNLNTDDGMGKIYLNLIFNFHLFIFIILHCKRAGNYNFALYIS